MNISNNKILITGATSGIGKALALKLHKLNNQIIAVGRNLNDLKKLEESNKRIIGYPCDLSDKQQVNQLIGFIKKEHQEVNILINNAGIQYNYDFLNTENLSSKVEDELMVNLFAPLYLTSKMIPVLIRNTNPTLVNVTSALGIVPKPDAPIYCATKAALHLFSRSLRSQQDKIRVVELIPPLVETAMTKGRGKNKITADELVDEFIKSFSNNREEINIGKVKLLRFINRLSPALAEKIVKG